MASLLLAGAQVQAARSIASVLVDLDNDMLIIEGADLSEGPTPIVSMPTFGQLGIVSSSTTMIEAILPANILSGDYTLSVRTGLAANQRTKYSLTIGAVGPQGPQGEPGADLVDGADGAEGPQGPAGPATTVPVSVNCSVAAGSIANLSESAPNFCVASCPAGKPVLGGGCNMASAGQEITTHRAQPKFSPDGFECGVKSLKTSGGGGVPTVGLTLTTTAICGP